MFVCRLPRSRRWRAPLARSFWVWLNLQMPSISIDNSRAPLLVIRFDGVVDDVVFDRYLQDIHDLGMRRAPGEQYAMLLDGRGGGRATASQRHRQTEFIRTHHAQLAEQCAGAAFVLTNPVARGVLTAMLWVQKMPYEHVVVGSMLEAEDWCNRHLAAGVDGSAPRSASSGARR